MPDLAFVDTNVLVYLYDAREPDKAAVSAEILGTRGRARELVLSAQVLSEFYVTVTAKFPRPLQPTDAEQIVADLGRFPFAAVDADTVAAACRRSRLDRVSYWDALIVETARGAGCVELLTEDLQDGRDFDGLRVVNPYAPR